MVQPTQAELQAHLAGQAQLLMGLVAVLDDNSDDDLDELANDDDLRDDYLSDSDALLMVALEYQSLAVSITGDGSRGPYNQTPRCKDFFSCCLQSPDREFRHYFRVGRDTFDRLVAKLADNPIFTSTGTKPQRHVKYQLGCFLFRYGMRGSDSLQVAKELAIGHDSVFKYCRRVSKAFEH
ncbi:hypothetical protein BDR07DRAFT_1582019 [Suillus spraguei]|nr:hypothetical protein BDR07DRAFT_1582019 [Suillus spraguei]